MTYQTGLGGSEVLRNASYIHTDMGRVTSNSRYDKEGIIDVVFLDKSTPFPVWVVGDIDRKPMTGDHVLVGYIGGRKDAPYLAGILKNLSYTTNFIEVDEKHIRLQLPVLDIGEIGGRAHNDTKTFLKDPTKRQERAYIEVNASGIEIYHPTGNVTIRTPNGSFIHD